MRFPNGLKIEEISIGDGATPDPGDTVTIEWRGWLNRGNEFGSGSVSFRIGGGKSSPARSGVIGMDASAASAGCGSVRIWVTVIGQSRVCRRTRS